MRNSGDGMFAPACVGGWGLGLVEKAENDWSHLTHAGSASSKR